MNKLFLSGFIVLVINSLTAQNSQWTSARPDGHAPISVMADHYHKKGEIMLSYRYMTMFMDGNISSSDNISNTEIYQTYMIAPQKMQMDMHMLGIMYAPSDFLTFMLMTNYISNKMDLRTKTGLNFSTTSSGIGDLSFSALIKLSNQNSQSIHGNIGVSIPTGNIDQKDDTPMMTNTKLAYPMQLGTGTWDPFLGLTYLGQSNFFSWGLQSIYKFRLSNNSRHYTLGNSFRTNLWAAFKVSNSFSFSMNFYFLNKAKIDGVDKDLNPLMMPLFNTANSGKSQLDTSVGINYYISKGSLKNLRSGLELKMPLMQNVNGIQMKRKLMLSYGIQYSFGH